MGVAAGESLAPKRGPHAQLPGTGGRHGAMSQGRIGGRTSHSCKAEEGGAQPQQTTDGRIAKVWHSLCWPQPSGGGTEGARSWGEGMSSRGSGICPVGHARRETSVARTFGRAWNLGSGSDPFAGGQRCGHRDRHACVPVCPSADSLHPSLDSFSAGGIARLDESLEDLAPRPRTSARRLVRMFRLVFIIVHLHQCMAAWRSSLSLPCRKGFRKAHPRFAHGEVADQSGPHGSRVAQILVAVIMLFAQLREPAARGTTLARMETEMGYCLRGGVSCPACLATRRGLAARKPRQRRAASMDAAAQQGGRRSRVVQLAARSSHEKVLCWLSGKGEKRYNWDKKSAGGVRHGASFFFFFFFSRHMQRVWAVGLCRTKNAGLDKRASDPHGPSFVVTGQRWWCRTHPTAPIHRCTSIGTLWSFAGTRATWGKRRFRMRNHPKWRERDDLSQAFCAARQA